MSSFECFQVLLCSYIEQIEKCYTYLYEILSYEREYFKELKSLQNLDVYPSAELIMIRKSSNKDGGDMTENITEMEVLQQELTIIHRKVATIRARRLEEIESRDLMERKLAKKTMEEAQNREFNTILSRRR